MNENDIKKCIKNGYAWNIESGTPKMEKMNPHTRNEIWKQANLDEKETYFSTKSAAQLAIATRREDERIAKRKADHDEAMKKAGYSPASGIAGFWTSSWTASEEATLMLGLDKSDFTAIEWGTELLKRKEEKQRFAREAADAAHAKMLEDGKNQTTPITPEQAKMLRVGDEFFYLQHGGGAPKYHVTLDKLKRSPDITKWKCFVNGLAYFTHEAALDKNKGVGSHETPKSETQHKEVVTDETQDKEPVKWAERTKGDIVLEGDDVSDANKKFDLQDTSSDIIFSVVHSWMEANGWIGKIVGEQTNYGHIIRARYLTPEWKAWKERQDAKSNGTEVETKRNTTDDSVTHPKHYTSHPSGIECIQVTEHMNFCRGNAVKYVWRAGEKGDEIEDLKKARWYLEREITRLEKAKEQK